MIDIENIDIKSFPSVLLEERGDLPRKCCVYFVVDKSDNIQYIGQTTNLHKRWFGHHRYCQLQEMEEVKIAYLACPETSLEALESELIKFFMPPLNRSSIPIRQGAPAAKEAEEKRASNCSNCNSSNTVSYGANSTGTPRIKCKDCGKVRTMSGRKRGGQPKEKPKTRAEIQADYRKRHGLTGNEHRKRKGVENE